MRNANGRRTLMVEHAYAPSDEPDRILAALERVSRGIRTHRQSVASRVGLTPLQLDIVQTIAEGSPPEPVVGKLAIEFGISQPTVTDALSALERKGFLSRNRDPGDGRRTTFALTLTGAELTTDAQRHQSVLRDAVDSLSRPEQHAALAVLLDLIGALLEADVIQVARTCPTCRFFQAHIDGPAECALLQIPLTPANFRVNCAEHVPALVA